MPRPTPAYRMPAPAGRSKRASQARPHTLVLTSAQALATPAAKRSTSQTPTDSVQPIAAVLSDDGCQRHERQGAAAKAQCAPP